MSSFFGKKVDQPPSPAIEEKKPAPELQKKISQAPGFDDDDEDMQTVSPKKKRRVVEDTSSEGTLASLCFCFIVFPA